jgi:prepilin-type N-terminal cleavage/methylation domain-containing protein
VRSLPRAHGARAGFTLAEVAVTLVIVGMTLLLVLEGLNSSRMTAAQAANRKTALELALVTLGRLESGLYWEELDGLGGTLDGSYAEEGYEEFYWEMVVGDDELAATEEEDEEGGYFDSFAHRRERQREEEYEDDEEDTPFGDTGSSGGPYERVKLRVTFPELTGQSNELVLERWIPLLQVFGRGDDWLPPVADGGGPDG